MIRVFFRKLQLNYLITSLKKEMQYTFNDLPFHVVSKSLESYSAVLSDLRNKKDLLK